jgi:hypothetical protein
MNLLNTSIAVGLVSGACIPSFAQSDLAFPGLLTVITNGPIYWGPIKLRRNVDEAKVADVGKAKGATIGFSNNRLLDGSGAWSSEGALVYPISNTNLTWFVTPATTWKLEETEEASKQDIQEWEFRAPITVVWERQNFTFIDLTLEPYFNTDFSWSHKIVGTTFDAGYTGQVPFVPIHLNDWQPVHKGAPWQYRLTARPSLDYSNVLNPGPHTSRGVDDDWLRIGARTGLELGLSGKNKWIVTFGLTYKFLETIEGDGGYSDLLRSYASVGLNKYTSLTLEYQKGDAPVSAKEIDLLKVALEVKF